MALGWWTTGLLTPSGLKALILPSITLCLFQLTLIMRLVRAEMLEVLRTDYIKFARARGLTDRAIHFGHALKNTLVPVITITGLQLGSIIAFAIITETVFQWPGMGLLFIQAVNFADIPVMAAYLCFIALVFVTINLVVDLLYYAVDPRLRIERGVGGRPLGSRAMTTPVDHIARWQETFTAVRRDLHQHPELGFEEERTGRVVREALAGLGIEHHAGIGRTGIVAVVRGARDTSGASIGLRADMDALPMQEENEFAHRSRYEGRMHGCGHDGHTTMLLAAARYLAETRRFDGTAYLIFQPGEEGYAGAKAMIEDGLFERFPAQQVFALHNWPGLPPGKIGLTPGPAMAAADRIEITIDGRGGHGAHPHAAVDPVLVAGHLITAAQSIVSRNVAPIDTAVVSLCAMQAGNPGAMSVIPSHAKLVGTVRTFRPATQDMIERRLHELVGSIAAAFGAKATLKYERVYPATVNHDGPARASPWAWPRRSWAGTTSCATSTRRWAPRTSRSCCRRSRAPSRAWGRAARKAAASCTTAATTSTMT